MTISRILDQSKLPDKFRNGVVAIGNFDGVHRGHQSVLARALKLAELKNIPALVMTFEPHPRAVFKPENAPFRLSKAEFRARLLDALGFDAVIEQKFDKQFASHSAEDYVKQVLIKRLGVSEVVTGFDFHFGKGREGGPAYMIDAGEKHGFGVTLVDAFRDENVEVISSSRIRNLIKDGHTTEAAGLLGYHFTLQGEVVQGKQLGRELGYPTANINLDRVQDLKCGIYAVRFRDQSGKLHDGVASCGVRPTVESDGAPIFETHLFDYSGDLYGQICSVSVMSYLRDEQKFDDLDALVAQMKLDEAEARTVLSTIKPISDLDRAICFE